MRAKATMVVMGDCRFSGPSNSTNSKDQTVKKERALPMVWKFVVFFCVKYIDEFEWVSLRKRWSWDPIIAGHSPLVCPPNDTQPLPCALLNLGNVSCYLMMPFSRLHYACAKSPNHRIALHDVFVPPKTESGKKRLCTMAVVDMDAPRRVFCFFFSWKKPCPLWFHRMVHPNTWSEWLVWHSCMMFFFAVPDLLLSHSMYSKRIVIDKDRIAGILLQVRVWCLMSWLLYSVWIDTRIRSQKNSRDG